MFSTLMLASVFAGCLDLDTIAPQASGDDNPDDAEETIHNETQDAPDVDETNVSIDETSPVPPGPSATAQLSADYTTGQVNFTVTFTIEGTHPDGGTLDWVLDYDDGSEGDSGDRVPAETEHTFTEQGEYLVMLMVFGNQSMGIDMMTITVLEGPNEAQPGESIHCLHRSVIQAGLHDAVMPPALAAIDATIKVEPETDYRIRLNDTIVALPDSLELEVYIDFFDGDGNWLGDNAGRRNGTVAPDAEYGVVCVTSLSPSWGENPVPLPAQGWVYRDGYVAPSS